MLKKLREYVLESFFTYLKREKAKEYSWFKIEGDDFEVYFIVKNTGGIAQSLLESQAINVGGSMKLNKHSAHTPKDQIHLHAEDRHGELFAMNVDGSAHHHSQGIRIPNKIADAIRQHLPNFTLPPGGIIEHLDLNHELYGLLKFLNK